MTISHSGGQHPSLNIQKQECGFQRVNIFPKGLTDGLASTVYAQRLSTK